MAEFDPKAYLAEFGGDEGKAKDFDPKAYLDEYEPKPPSRGEAFLMGFPKLGGATKEAFARTAQASEALRRVTPFLPGTAQDILFGKADPRNPEGDVNVARRLFQEDADAAKEAHPGFYTGGEVAGSLALPLPGAGKLAEAGAAIKAAPAAAKVAAFGKQIPALMGAGAQGGAAIGAYTAESLDKVLPDAVKGALLGGVATPAAYPAMAGIAKVLGVPLEALGNWLESKGIQVGRRVLTGGANPLAVKKPVSDEAVKEAFEQGAFKPLGTTQGAAARLSEAREASGDQYAKVVDRLEKAGVPGPDARKLAEGIFAEGAAIEKRSVGTGVPEFYEKTGAELETKEASGQFGLSQAEDIKRSLSEKANYDRIQGDTLMEHARKDLASRVRQAVEDAVDEGTSNHPNPEIRALGEEFKPIKEQLGRIIEASDAANKGAAQAERRAQMPLTSKGVGIATAASTLGTTGSPLAAAVTGKGAAEAMSMLQARGPSTKAWAYLTSSKALQSMADKMADNPRVQASVFGPLLARARERGAEALAVTHHMLQAHPDYQALMRESAGESTP